MNNNKKLLIFVIAFSLLYILISIIYNLPSGEKFNKTVFLGSSTKIQINGKDITVKNDDTKIKKQKVKIYYKNKFIDGYIFNKNADSSGVDNNYSVVNNNGENILLDSPLVAHTLDLSIEVLNSETIDYVDIKDVYKFAAEENIELSDSITLNFSNIKEFDYDGEKIYIYSIGIVEDETNYYSIVFMKKNDKYYLIDRADSEYLDVNRVGLNFFNIIDFNNDGNYEFVVEKMMSEYGPNYYELYNFDGSKFIKIGGE